MPNDFFETLDRAHPQSNFYYIWDQIQPVLGAIAIFVIGWIAAVLIAGGVKALLQKVGLNTRTQQTTQSNFNLEQLISRIVFWFIFIVALVAGLNSLNLTTVSAPFANMINSVVTFIPTLIAAIIVGFVGWLIATLVRTSLNRALAKTSLDEKLSQDAGIAPISQNLAEIAYWLVLLLFLPIVLSILGLAGLLAPVQVMMTEAITYIPNLFIAGVVFFVGYVLAKIVRGIVETVANGINLQARDEQFGLKIGNLPKLLGSVVFAVVIITATIIAFDALGVKTISQPATAMLQQTLAAIPNILAAMVILVVAFILSKFVARLVSDILANTGIDEVPTKLDIQRFLGQTKVSSLVGTLIVFFVMLFATSEAANRLQFENVSQLISMFIQFGANIFLGAVILVIGFWLATIVANIVQRGKNSRWLANLVRVLIMGLVLAMGLKAMGIADSIVNLAFGLTLGSVAVAFALAFGLGGRLPAERLLSKLLDNAEKAKKENNSEQN